MDFKDQEGKTEEIYGLVNQRMQGIHNPRTMTRGKLSVFVADAWVIARKILCPAIGKTCSNCGKQGHFGGVCKGASKRATSSQNIAQQWNANDLQCVTTEHDTGSDEEYLWALGGNMEDNTVQITVEGTSTSVTVDSGASVNVLDSITFNRLSNTGVNLRNSSVKIYTYGSKTPLPVKGTFSANVSLNFTRRPTSWLLKI